VYFDIEFGYIATIHEELHALHSSLYPVVRKCFYHEPQIYSNYADGLTTDVVRVPDST